MSGGGRTLSIIYTVCMKHSVFYATTGIALVIERNIDKQNIEKLTYHLVGD